MASTYGAHAAQGSRRPNILFIMSDDHAAHAISAYGSKVNQTPNLDRLAREGALLTNVFVTNSITTPLRLAAESDAPDECVVLVTESDEAIARLFYAYQDATLGLEFLHQVEFPEFDAEILFKDGSQFTSHNVKIIECKAVLGRTSRTEDQVARVVLSPKELSATIKK